MKRIIDIKYFFLVVCLLSSMFMTNAHDFEVDGIYYLDNGTDAVVTFKGEYGSEYSDDYSGSVRIPSTVEYNGKNYNVTSIGDLAFWKCSNLTSVDIPNSVTAIGVGAFSDCSGLTCVNIPNSVTSISSVAFMNCSKLSNITISNSVGTIEMGVFANCTSLISIVIPNTVTTIGLQAFSNCNSLTNITIPSSITKIGNGAFYSCSALVTLNYNAVNCEDFTDNQVFKNTNITTINIGDEVKRIPAYLAYGLNRLTNITIPSSVTYIGDCAFGHCESLANIIVENNNPIFDSRNNCNAVIKTSTNELIIGCKNSTIPNSITSIGESAFYDCSGLTNVIIPASVRTIYSKAFYNCSALQSVYCYASTPPVLESSDCYNTYSSTSLYVLLPSFEEYNTTNYWNQFTKIYAVDNDGNILVTELSLNVTNKNMYVDESFELTATITPDVASNKTVSWTSSDNSVATVDCNGVVTALATGTAVIKASTTDGSNLSASCNVTVRQLATSITLDETEATIYTGNTLQLTATVSPSTTSNPSVNWTSSNTSVATVSSTGVVTAKSTGTAVITAKTADGSNLSATCKVTVKRLATSISLNKTSATLYLNETVQLTATVSPSNATDRSVLWSSSDNNVAKVSSAGLVIAIAPGNATITATTADGSNLSATCAITVKAYVTSLTLDPSEATILEGDTITLTPTILPTYATNQSLTWSSSNSNVAFVNNGVVIARSGGEATITARTTDDSNLYASCKVTVIPNFDVSAPDISHIRGSLNNKFELTIDLDNRYDITGMQFDVQFPDGVTIAKDINGDYDILLDNYRKSRNHTVTASLIGYNTYRILVSSATANILKGHSGTVLHIMIEIPISHVSGNKQVKFSNIILSEPDETRYTLPTKYSMISYYYLEGDANADVSVDVADYVITGNYILQNSPEDFWRDAANVDHNSTVDVNDLTGITNIALGRREGGILQMPAMQSPEENRDIELTADPLVIQAGQTKTLSLSLEGLYSFAGFQMDIQLPKSIKLADASLANDNGDFSIATADLPDGSIRLLASSFSLKDITVNDAAFLKLTLTADGNFSGNDVITLDGIKFSERDMALHAIDGFEIPVGNEVSSLEQLYSGIRIYTDGANIIIDSPESGTARIVTIAGITQVREITPGHNVIPMDNFGIYIVTLNGTTAKLYLK